MGIGWKERNWARGIVRVGPAQSEGLDPPKVRVGLAQSEGLDPPKVGVSPAQN